MPNVTQHQIADGVRLRPCWFRIARQISVWAKIQAWNSQKTHPKTHESVDFYWSVQDAIAPQIKVIAIFAFFFELLCQNCQALRPHFNVVDIFNLDDGGR